MILLFYRLDQRGVHHLLVLRKLGSVNRRATDSFQLNGPFSTLLVRNVLRSSYFRLSNELMELNLAGNMYILSGLDSICDYFSLNIQPSIRSQSSIE